jgi:hypothetical protein
MLYVVTSTCLDNDEGARRKKVGQTSREIEFADSCSLVVYISYVNTLTQCLKYKAQNSVTVYYIYKK